VLSGQAPKPLSGAPKARVVDRGGDRVWAILIGMSAHSRSPWLRVSDRTVCHLISTGYLSLESRDVAASVAIALEAWIYDNVT
jgi:hypothetical protein